MFNNINIYWINLNRATERKEKMINIFNDYKLKHTRIEAVDGNDIDLEEIKKNYKIDEGMSKYEIACSMSHIKAIEIAYNNDLDHVLIFEDDVRFDYLKYHTISIESLIDKLLSLNGDCIQLSCTLNTKQIKFIINHKDLLIKYNISGGTVAYLITKNGMKKILDNYYNNKIIERAEPIIYKKLNNYICKPYFTYDFYKQNKSFIRRNVKSTHTTQTISKKAWDNYYGINN